MCAVTAMIAAPAPATAPAVTAVSAPPVMMTVKLKIEIQEPVMTTKDISSYNLSFQINNEVLPHPSK